MVARGIGFFQIRYAPYIVACGVLLNEQIMLCHYDQMRERAFDRNIVARAQLVINSSKCQHWVEFSE